VRGPKVYDWSKCRCGPGLKTFKLSSGALRCQDAKSKFVRATCDEDAYDKAGQVRPPAKTAAKTKAPAKTAAKTKALAKTANKTKR
jgi:hypothetical protein